MVTNWQFPSDSVCPPEDEDDEEDEYARQKYFHLAGQPVFLVHRQKWAGTDRTRPMEIRPAGNGGVSPYLLLLAGQGDVDSLGQLCHDDLSMAKPPILGRLFAALFSLPEHISLSGA